MNSIEQITKKNLCIGCGVCQAVCPKECISFHKEKGMYMPVIGDRCVTCGACLRVCSSVPIDYTDCNESNFWQGEYRHIIKAQAKDEDLLQQSTSGGAVTQIIQHLLDKAIYESAFLVDGYHYDQMVQTKRFTKESSLKTTTKSRYLPVAQTNAVQYMLAHRDEKIILVGTSCFVHAVRKVIQRYRLNEQNYLILGLFCDKTMTYQVYEYFKQHHQCTGKLQEMYFRTKEAGGWPGNMRLVFADGGHQDLNKTERMKVKEYFQPEACLYCLDKLNQYADISFGDNYIKENHDSKGVSSVVIRSAVGEQAWKICAHLFKYHEDTIEALEQSQHLENRIENLNFSLLKGLETKVPKEILAQTDPEAYRSKYQARLKKINIGNAPSFAKMKTIFIAQKGKRKFRGFVRKIIKQ